MWGRVGDGADSLWKVVGFKLTQTPFVLNSRTRYDLALMDDRKQLSTLEIDELVAEYPALPADYLTYLRDVGWGKAISGHMIYSGPIRPSEVYPRTSVQDQKVVLGDDSQGFCLGYDFRTRTYGEFSDAGEWSSFRSDFILKSLLSASN